jgi:hypothetical protein
MRGIPERERVESVLDKVTGLTYLHARHLSHRTGTTRPVFKEATNNISTIGSGIIRCAI